MRKCMCRVISFMLAFLLIIGGCGMEAFAATCAASDSYFGYGWNSMSGSFKPATFGGGTCQYSPTLALKISGNVVPAYCLDHGKWVGNGGANYKCRTSYSGHGLDAARKQALVSSVLAVSDQIGGIKIISEYGYTTVHRRYGSSSSDRWLVTQILVWSVTGGGVIWQANGRIGVTPEGKSDVSKAIASVVGGGNRPNDVKALKAYADDFYKRLDNLWKIPSFAYYTSTHPMGDQINGKPGLSGGNGTIILDRSCKQPDGTYKKVIEDKNGVLKNFDFSGQFGEGYSGIQISQSGNKLTITYDGSTGCWKDESEEIKTKVAAGSSAVAFWQHSSGSTGAQFLATYLKNTSELGCKVNLEIRDCGDDDTPLDKSPSVSSPGTTSSSTAEIITTTPPVVTETPNVETPPPAPPEVYIRKTSDDGNVSGIVFTITGNGETYHKKTDESGFLDVSDLPQYIEGTQQLIEYHVEEEIPVEYVHDRDNASKNFVLEPGKTQYLEFENKRKMWRLTFKKHDDTLATQAQGKGTLAGAVFALYQNGDFLASYTTDENGVITTDYWPCGPGYTMTEVTAPDGYKLDSTVYAVGLMPGETIEQYNDCNRMEPLDGDDPEVIRQVYSVKSALEYKASLKGD